MKVNCNHKNSDFDYNNNRKCLDCGKYEWDWEKTKGDK